MSGYLSHIVRQSSGRCFCHWIGIKNMKISKNEQFSNLQEVSIDAPVSVFEQFDCKYVCYLFLDETIDQPSVSGVPRQNAFEVLMSSCHKVVLPSCIGLATTTVHIFFRVEL